MNIISGQFCQARKRGRSWSLRWREFGRRREKALGRLTVAQVREKVAEADSALARGRGLSGPDRRTLSVAIGEFLDTIEARVAPATVKTYACHLKDFSEFIGLGCRTDRIGRENVQRYADRTAKKLSAASVGSRIGTLKAFFAFLGRPEAAGGIQTRKPTDRIREPYKSPQDARKLVSWALEIAPEFGRAVALAYYTGARLASIQALNWSDIDFDAEKIVFFKNKGKREYTIPLSPDLKKILRPAAADGPGDRRFRAVNPYIFANPQPCPSLAGSIFAP